MQENQTREQYFFEDETLAWLGEICSGVERVGAVFMPSMLRFPNAWVFDADERFAGAERYTRIDVTRSVPSLQRFDLVMLDPPFLLRRRHLARLLKAAAGRPVLVSASDWCVACAGWGTLFRDHGLAQVSAHFPRYRSIGNGYCESAVKRDGRTNISFFSNLSFAPPRRPIVLRQETQWLTFDPYDFERTSVADSPPADEPGSGALSPASAKSREIASHWVTIHGLASGVIPPQIAANSGLRARLRRWAWRLASVLGGPAG